MCKETIELQKLRWEKRKFWITAIGGAALFLVGLWQFGVTSRNDFAKPVLERQLELCLNAAGAAAKLVEVKRADSQGFANSQTARDFMELYFGKLAVVENQCLYNAMVDYRNGVFLDKEIGPEGLITDGSKGYDDGRLALRVAFACRQMVSKNWNSGLVSLYDPQGLFQNFVDLNDYKNSKLKMRGC